MEELRNVASTYSNRIVYLRRVEGTKTRLCVDRRGTSSNFEVTVGEAVFQCKWMQGGLRQTLYLGTWVPA